MPGMIDAHWHSILAGICSRCNDRRYSLCASRCGTGSRANGSTRLYDRPGCRRAWLALKRTIDEGRIVGPGLCPSGAMISQTSGHGDFRMRTDLPRTSQSGLSIAEQAGISATADGEAGVLRRVREQLMLGARQIKIMGGGVSSSFDPIDSLQYTRAEMKAAVSAAADRHLCPHPRLYIRSHAPCARLQREIDRTWPADRRGYGQADCGCASMVEHTALPRRRRRQC